MMTAVSTKSTVEFLRNNGYKVRVTHRRVYNEDTTLVKRLDYSNNVWWGVEVTRPAKESSLYTRSEAYEKGFTDVNLYGGSTTVEITTPDGKDFVGVSECSTLDLYNRKIGRNMALGRAIKEMENAA